MKTYVHARVSGEDRRALERLKRATGQSESELVRRGLNLVQAQVQSSPSALDAAGRSAGRFSGGPPDLSTNPRHLDDLGR
jgi:hypothetical protein